jgi:hypothetical protein
MNFERILFGLVAILLGFCIPLAHAANTQLNPTDIGNFDKRQFVTPQQALTLGKDLGDVLGYIAIAGSDGSLTITSCRKINGTNAVVTTADLTQPVFSAVIDGSWGLKATLTFLNISDDGNTKITVSATDIADAVLPQANIPDQLSAPVTGCTLPSNATLYYVQKATLTLINKVTYVKNGASGSILNILNISGASYDQTDQTNMYTVSVFALPIFSATPSALTVVRTAGQLRSLDGNVKALGIDKVIQGHTAEIVSPDFSSSLKPAILSPSLLRTFKSD